MAENKGFDLAAYLGSLDLGPESGTGREQLEYIGLDLIDDDEENFYETKGIKELAANIALFGLMDPLRIRPHPDKPGRYKVTSGHRRRLALKALQEDDPEKYEEAPCIIDQVMQSSALQELKLIFANKDNRKYSPADLSEEAVRVEKLLYQLKEEGYEFPGRMRDHVAKAVGASKSKLSRLKVIRENLIPIWEPLYKQNKISESEAYALAQLEPQWQNIMYNRWGNNLRSFYAGHAINTKNVLEKIAKVKCEHYPDGKCIIQPERQKHIAGLSQYDNYSCSSCCMDCSRLSDCKDCCSLAIDKRTGLIQRRTKEKAAKKTEEKKRIAPTLDQIRGIYARWFDALNTQGLTAEEYMKACGCAYIGDDAKNYEKYAMNPQKITAENIKLPFARNTWISDAKALIAAADVLGCSIDWLLGRDVPGPGDVPELGPAEEEYNPWGVGEDENPITPGNYVVLAKWSEHGKMKPHIFAWDGDKWLYAGMDAAAAGAIVCYWMPMPEE